MASSSLNRRLCVPKLYPFDLVAESLNVSDDGRAAPLFIDAVGLAAKVEKPP
jgi:hypothetical protein